ncbi:putative aromatic compound monooxygenase YhjG [Rhypophila decipiens]
MSDCDVLIVGAGPVGTALALELALHKVSFRVVDKFPARSDKSRALVVQARTLELLNRHGVAHALASRGQYVTGTLINIDRKPVTWMNLEGCSPADAEFPLPLMLSQAETEQFLDECLAKHGATVETSVTAKSIVQDSTGVTTELEGPDGKRETVRSKYVVGCDGAHSIVRHSATNLTFEGAAYPQDFVLCDAYLRDSHIAKDRISMHFGYGLLVVMPLGGGLFRIIVSGSASNPVDNISQINQQSEVALEHVQKALETFTSPGCGTLHDPVWLSRFRLHHRGVNNYRDGRLFLAGDAAHIHSPAGGQGMNTGVHDAFNLGWKLAAVLHEKTPYPEALLDSYNTERYPIGQQLLRGTDRLFTFVASTNFLFVRLRNFILPWILPWLWSSKERVKTAYQFISELGINYRGSPIVGSSKGFTGPVAGGDRLPDGELKKRTLSENGQIEEEALTRVHHICVGAGHHLIFFTADDREHPMETTRASIEETMTQVKTQAKSNDIDFHVLGTGGLDAFDGGSLAQSLYLDRDGVVHQRYGFKQTPGYVLARPDGYIAHIGPLSSVDDLFGFLGRYF